MVNTLILGPVSAYTSILAIESPSLSQWLAYQLLVLCPLSKAYEILRSRLCLNGRHVDCRLYTYSKQRTSYRDITNISSVDVLGFKPIPASTSALALTLPVYLSQCLNGRHTD